MARPKTKHRDDPGEEIIRGRLDYAAQIGMANGITPPEVAALRPLLAVLPVAIARERVAEVLGLELSPKTLANMDSLQTGPRLRFLVGHRAMYPTAYLLEWMERRGLEVVARRDA
ncbi:MAG: hypothetical protein EOL86_13710 [Deltaproteobacteria bacterium]|nr:hypothetical protein [Deltaproteobacteria bacterium]